MPFLAPLRQQRLRVLRCVASSSASKSMREKINIQPIGLLIKFID